jgi:hypothetical protein
LSVASGVPQGTGINRETTAEAAPIEAPDSDEPGKYDALGKYGPLLEDIDRADFDLGADLWLIAERIMLYRLTRAGFQKRIELAGLVRAITDIISGAEGASAVPKEVRELDKSASEQFTSESETTLSRVFSVVVDVSETMNNQELYKLIEYLRSAPLPREPFMNIEPLDRAQEYLNDSPYGDESGWTL